MAKQFADTYLSREVRSQLPEGIVLRALADSDYDHGKKMPFAAGKQ